MLGIMSDLAKGKARLSSFVSKSWCTHRPDEQTRALSAARMHAAIHAVCFRSPSIRFLVSSR